MTQVGFGSEKFPVAAVAISYHVDDVAAIEELVVVRYSTDPVKRGNPSQVAYTDPLDVATGTSVTVAL
jgi:hypothetical protein